MKPAFHGTVTMVFAHNIQEVGKLNEVYTSLQSLTRSMLLATM